MLAPKNLKVGDTFNDNGVIRRVTEVIPFVGYKTEITSSGVKIAEEKKEVSDDLDGKTIKELQDMCKEKGLSIRGTKMEVIKRLRGV